MLTIVMLHRTLAQRGGQGVLKRKRQMWLTVHGVDETVAQALSAPTGKRMGKGCAAGGLCEQEMLVRGRGP
jgi:hypothetical protein